VPGRRSTGSILKPRYGAVFRPRRSCVVRGLSAAGIAALRDRPTTYTVASTGPFRRDGERSLRRAPRRDSRTVKTWFRYEYDFGSTTSSSSGPRFAAGCGGSAPVSCWPAMSPLRGLHVVWCASDRVCSYCADERDRCSVTSRSRGTSMRDEALLPVVNSPRMACAVHGRSLECVPRAASLAGCWPSHFTTLGFARVPHRHPRRVDDRHSASSPHLCPLPAVTEHRVPLVSAVRTQHGRWRTTHMAGHGRGLIAANSLTAADPPHPAANLGPEDEAPWLNEVVLVPEPSLSPVPRISSRRRGVRLRSPSRRNDLWTPPCTCRPDHERAAMPAALKHVRRKNRSRSENCAVAWFKIEPVERRPGTLDSE